MKKQLLLLFIFTLKFTLAQTTSKLSISESDEYKDDVKSYNILSIHTSKTGQTAIIRNSKKNILYDVFDSNLKKVSSKVIESSKKETFVGDLFFGDEIKFFTVFAPKKNERILYCHIFNLKDKSHKKVQLFKTTVVKNQRLFSGKNKRETSFAISPNGKFFAITTDNIKKNVNSYTIHLYNSNTLKLVYKKAYQEHAKRFFEHNDLSVDNYGIVYALGKLFIDGKSQKKNGDANYQFVLNKISYNEYNELAINLDEEHIQSLSISTVNNQLHLIGFYSEKNIRRIKGGCNFIIEPEKFTIKDKKTYVLPPKVYEDLYSYRKANKKKDNELSSFVFDYVINDSDGNTFLLAEEFYVTTSYVSTGTGTGHFVTTYHYDDILILKFNNLGELDWGRSIFKRANKPSYNAFLKEDKLHVILNSGKNLTEKNDGRTKASKGWFESSALYDFVYSNTGEVSYDKIQNNKGKTYYLPYHGTFENDIFIMMSSKKSKKKFMILK